MSQKQQLPYLGLEGIANPEKVKSGRKKKEETSRYLETPMNPYYKVYERLMRYLESIGLIHGLCFTAELRRSLKQFNKYSDIQWKENNYGWYYTEQLENLKKDNELMRRIRRIMFAIKARCRKLKRLSAQNKIQLSEYMHYHTLEKWTLNKIIDFVIRPGEMVDPECRNQFYILNVTLLESIFAKRQSRKSNTKQYALKFFDISRYFSRKFTAYKKKNWIEIKRCPQEQIDKHFIKLFAYFKKNYEDILYNFYEWDSYNTDMKVLFDEEDYFVGEIPREVQVKQQS